MLMVLTGKVRRLVEFVSQDAQKTSHKSSDGYYMGLLFVNLIVDLEFVPSKEV